MLSNQLIKYMYKGISVLQLPTCITVWPCISTLTATRRTYTRDMITWLIDTITYFGTIISEFFFFTLYKLKSYHFE
jgi:hypothetical protein